MLRFIFGRYLAYGFIFIEILVVPELLTPNKYANFEYLKSLVALSSLVLLGSHTGYIYYNYTKRRNYFDSLLKVAFFQLLIVGLVVGLVQNSLILFIPIVSMGLSAIFEKRLQISRQFYLAILFKPLCSVMFLILILSFDKIYHEFTDQIAIVLGYFLALISWELISRINGESMGLLKIANAFSINRLDFYKFFRMVKTGIVENMATIVLGLILFTDRYVLKNYFVADLPAYSLAFNFAQFVFIGINSLTYILAIDLSEKFSQLTRSEIKGVAKKSIGLYMLLLIAVMLLAMGYDAIFGAYESFLIYTFILSLFVGFFYALNTTSVIVLLANKQHLATSLCITVFLLNIIVSYIFLLAELSPILFIVKTVVLLAICGLSIFIISLKVIKKA